MLQLLYSAFPSGKQQRALSLSFVLLSPLRAPLCFTVIWHISCTSIYRVLVGSVHNGLNPLPPSLTPPFANVLCCTNSQVAKARGRIGCAFCGVVGKGGGWRGKGCRGRVTWFDLYVQLCVCVCVCAAHISYFILELCEFWFAAFKQIFSKCSQPARSPPPLPSRESCLTVSLQGILCILFAIMAALLRGRVGVASA